MPAELAFLAHSDGPANAPSMLQSVQTSTTALPAQTATCSHCYPCSNTILLPVIAMADCSISCSAATQNLQQDNNISRVALLVSIAASTGHKCPLQ